MGLFRKKKRRITVLEIDKGQLKIVQARLSAKERKIETVIGEKLVPETDNKISERIKILSKDLDIDSDNLIVSVPEEVVAVRNLKLPSTDAEEIKNMVELQAGKQTPFTKDEIIYDYEILSCNEEGYSRVMLAIVHKDIIRRYFKILETSGLKTENIALSAEGLAVWLRFACKQGKGNNPYALVNVDSDKGSFVVILKDRLIFSRSISVSSPVNGSLTEEWQKSFIEEINHSLYGYQNEMIDKEIYRIVITGADVFTSELNESVLKDNLGLSVEIIPQFKNIPMTKRCLGSLSNSAKDLSMPALFGLVFAYPQQKINLIPAELRMEKALRKRGKDIYFFGICSALILIIASSIFLGRIYNKEQYLTQLKQEILKNQKPADRLIGMRQQIEKVKKRLQMKDFALNLIYDIHKTIPPEIYLISVSFDGSDQLILRGVSSSMPAVFRFVNALEKLEYFQNVNTKFATTRKEKDKELTDFEIVCPLGKKIKRQLAESR